MNEFDNKAATWDENPVHMKRSLAIASLMQEVIPLRENMSALEFGGGTGLLSILLKDKFNDITLLDSSTEMIRITREKIKSFGITNLEARVHDLEKEVYPGTFDVIYSQMAFHHVNDIEGIIKKFHEMLNPGGYVAIADLYTEDGSFHDEAFTGHKGFDPGQLAEQLVRNGFTGTKYSECFVVRKTIGDSTVKEYPVFLLTGQVK